MIKKLAFYFLLVTLAAAAISSCRTTKIVNDDVIAEEDSIESINARIKLNALNFSHFNANLNLNLKSEAFSGSLTGKCRVIKDSLIWMSFSKFGFEGARVLITKDSIFAFERIERTFVRSAITEIAEIAGIDVNYHLLEDLLIGNPYMGKDKFTLTFNNNDTLTIMPQIEMILLAHTFDRKDYLLHKSSMEEIRNGYFANMSYGAYQEISDGKKFSYFRSIEITEEKENLAAVNINFSNPELNIEKPIVFEIPKNYSERTF